MVWSAMTSLSPDLPWLLCLTGAECTGKSTLALDLAAAYGAPCVAEFARQYLAGATSYGADDLRAIAEGQLAAERRALAAGAPVVVADTDVTVIAVWWQEKYGPRPDWLQRALAERSPRRYLLPRPDLPWVFDPLRESPNDRPRLHQRYRELLAAGPFEYAEIGGLGEGRMQAARRQVDVWLADAATDG